MESIPITTWVSLIALAISAIGIFRTFHRDSAEETAFNVTMSTKLDAISQGVDDIRVEMRTIREKQNDMNARISAIEANVKGLSNRVDHLENKGG